MLSPHRSIELRTLDLESAALVKRIANGDVSAFATLYDMTSSLLLGVALRIVGDTVTAEDVLCETYTQARRQAAECDRGRESPLTWLVMLTRRLAIDQLRSCRQDHCRPEMYDPANNAITPGNQKVASPTTELQKTGRSTLAVLSPEERSVLDLSFYSGLNCLEVADRLDIPVCEAKARMRNGMIKLREQLRSLKEENPLNISPSKT